MPCGDPQCLKVKDPAAYVSTKDPGEKPWTFTFVTLGIFVFGLAFCCCPWLCTVAARWVGILEMAAEVANPADLEMAAEAQMPEDATNGLIEVAWSDMTIHQRSAAHLLGFTEKTWDNAGTNAVTEKDWDELTSAEEEAAYVLGYTQETWDAIVPIFDNESVTPNETHNALATNKVVAAGEKEWNDLTTAQQHAAQVLGYTQGSWDTGETDYKVAADDKDWDDLTSPEQQAAQALGYTQGTWDA